MKNLTPDQLNELLSLLNKDQNFAFFVALITIIINLAILIINYIKPFQLKKVDVKINRQKLREELRITIQTELYKKINTIKEIPLYEQDKEKRINELNKLTHYVEESKLFLTKGIIKITQDFIDYSLQVIQSDGAKKDISKENMFIKKYYEEFNK